MYLCENWRECDKHIDRRTITDNGWHLCPVQGVDCGFTETVGMQDVTVPQKYDRWFVQLFTQ